MRRLFKECGPHKSFDGSFVLWCYYFERVIIRNWWFVRQNVLLNLDDGKLTWIDV